MLECGAPYRPYYAPSTLFKDFKPFGHYYIASQVKLEIIVTRVVHKNEISNFDFFFSVRFLLDVQDPDRALI